MEISTGTTAVETLYNALVMEDTTTVVDLITPDLEWWFHGPPDRHHMMRTLTGKATADEFVFTPRSVMAVGGVVVAEGWELEGKKDVYWVHVWTVTDGVITGLREYFNTALKVKEVGGRKAATVRSRRWNSIPAVWKSGVVENLRKSLPCLVLVL